MKGYASARKERARRNGGKGVRSGRMKSVWIRSMEGGGREDDIFKGDGGVEAAPNWGREGRKIDEVEEILVDEGRQGENS